MLTLLLTYLLACGDGHDHDHDHDHFDLPTGDAEVGEPLFTQSCSGCHGADGTGGYGGPDLLGQTTDHIADYIWNGKGNMPAFPDYTDQDVADIIAHIRVLEENE